MCSSRAKTIKACGPKVSSNQYLSGDQARISDRDVATLVALGWHAPDRPPPQPGVKNWSGGSPNFYVDLDAPVDASCIARMAVTTLQLVLEVPSVATLRYYAFSKSQGRLLFSDLGIGLSDS